MIQHCCIAVILSVTIVTYLRDVYGNECGTTYLLQTNILGGVKTNRGEWPFLAAFYYTDKSTFFCAGTVISSKHILTGTKFSCPRNHVSEKVSDSLKSGLTLSYYFQPLIVCSKNSQSTYFNLKMWWFYLENIICQKWREVRHKKMLI